MPLKFTLALLAAAAIYGQPASQPSFEVASIKPGGDIVMTRPHRSTGRISWTTDVCRLIAYAHSVELSQLTGQKCGNVYVLEATYDAMATEDQVRLMVLSLLTERFRLRTHRETSVAEGYALLPAKGGPKIKEYTSTSRPPSSTDGAKEARSNLPLDNHIYTIASEPGVFEVTGHKVAISRLADALKYAVDGLPVWDRTGLSGVYSFKFRYANATAPPDTSAPSLAAALQETFGFRLEKAKGMVEKLVVDSFEKPSEN